MASQYALDLSNINSIMGILGTTTPNLWPFWESTGTNVTGIAATVMSSSDEAAVRALESEFSPILHRGGLYSYFFEASTNNHLKSVDNAAYSFGNATVDSAFSVGAYIIPNTIASNVIIGKFGSVANLEEYRFWIDAAGLLDLELHDASASASEIAVSTAALVLGQGVFVAATYDGGETAPVVWLYKNGERVSSGVTAETGSYVAMEDTATPLLIGAGGVTAAPLTEFSGRMALPFLTGKELSQSDITALHNIYKELLGLS